jgi:mono/diheme cytochrome c family protein
VLPMTAPANPFRKLSARAVALGALCCAALVVHQAGAGERAKADVVCRETAQPLKYSCTIRLSRRRDAAPVTGARIVIKAEMPSMPMAHNVRPVTALESGTPGSYQATLVLEMQGSWALRLQISGPLRDIIVASVDAGHSPGHVGTSGRSKIEGYADPEDTPAVSRGRRVYAHNCANCHGNELQGELQAGSDVPKGEKPAPPLNGGGHSPHHSDADMFTTVNGASPDGGQSRPGRMPRFGPILTDDDIWAVIAYMKSRWPDSIRRLHAEMFPRQD